MRGFWLLVLSVSVAIQPSVFAELIVADSCQRQDVQSAINKARDGDSVQVPAGSCVWGDRVEIVNKRLSLIGSGIDQSNIKTTVSDGFNAALWIDSTKPVRVTGFTFTGTPGDKGVIHMRGSMTGWRVDNVKFLDLDGKPLDILSMGGVVDHNQFIGEIRSTHVRRPDGNQMWQQGWQPGGSDAVFFEDNLWDKTSRSTIVSCVEGCRYVFRYNTVKNGTISTHGADTPDRAGGALEVYNNVFTSEDEGRAVFMRGGTAIIFNNEFYGYHDPIALANYRTCYDISWVGVGNDNNRSRCDGSQPIDGNHARPGHTGIHDGSSGSETLSDSSKSFQANAFVGWHVWNLTDGSMGKVISSSSTTLSASLTGGADNDWDSGDAYKVTSGWPCKDQVGRGPGGGIGNQPSEPIYQWNNSWSRFGGSPVSVQINPNSGYTCDAPSVDDQIQEGQDYFDNSARPAYEPFQYPHPVALGDDIPSPPQNLTIVQN